jgi:hypothetical protein
LAAVAAQAAMASPQPEQLDQHQFIVQRQHGAQWLGPGTSSSSSSTSRLHLGRNADHQHVGGISKPIGTTTSTSSGGATSTTSSSGGSTSAARRREGDIHIIVHLIGRA